MLKKIFLVVLMAGFAATAEAQTTVTFNLNLQSMLEDSTFVPGRDIVQVTGNFYPIDNNPKQLFDEAPADSIYTVKVNFSRRNNNQELRYNFEIVTPEETLTEHAPRNLLLRGDEIELSPLYFNSFAM